MVIQVFEFISGGKINEPSAAGTSNLDWKLIGMNSTFAQILGKLKRNKMSENLKNFENLKEKKNPRHGHL